MVPNYTKKINLAKNWQQTMKFFTKNYDLKKILDKIAKL